MKGLPALIKGGHTSAWETSNRHSLPEREGLNFCETPQSRTQCLRQAALEDERRQREDAQRHLCDARRRLTETQRQRDRALRNLKRADQTSPVPVDDAAECAVAARRSFARSLRQLKGA